MPKEFSYCSPIAQDMAIFPVSLFLCVYPSRGLYLGFVQEKEVSLNTNYLICETDVNKIVGHYLISTLLLNGCHVNLANAQLFADYEYKNPVQNYLIKSSVCLIGICHI